MSEGASSQLVPVDHAELIAEARSVVREMRLPYSGFTPRIGWFLVERLANALEGAVSLRGITPEQIALVIGEGWRHGWSHRHSIACGDGDRCNALGALILEAIQSWVPCPLCDGTRTAKRGDEKGYSCRCYTGIVPPAVAAGLNASQGTEVSRGE